MATVMLTVVLALVITAPILSAQTITERLAERSRDKTAPLVIGTLSEPMPLSVEELTRQSDLTVEARLSPIKSYIDSSDTAVITDFTVQLNRVLAGTLPNSTSVPGATRLVVTAYGGEVVRDGVIIRAQNHNLAPLKTDDVYLLFLKRFGKKPGVYAIYNSGVFALTDGKVNPLAIPPTLFKDLAGASYAQVSARVAESARSK